MLKDKGARGTTSCARGRQQHVNRGRHAGRQRGLHAGACGWAGAAKVARIGSVGRRKVAHVGQVELHQQRAAQAQAQRVQACGQASQASGSQHSLPDVCSAPFVGLDVL